MAGVETLKALFDEKKIKVLQVFIQKPTEQFLLKDVVKKSKVSLATTHRILKTLSSLEILAVQKFKHLATYKLAKNESTQYLMQLFYERPSSISKFINLASSIAGIQKIIMHGEEREDRANIVIVGTDIEKEQVNLSVALIREEDNYTISHLILEPEQFSMLESMGQFSGQQTILLDR